MTSGNLTDENIKSLCYLLRIFETRIAITIMRNQHQHHDCEEDITMLDIANQNNRSALIATRKLMHADIQNML